MELTELLNKTLDIFEVSDVKDLGDAIMNTVLTNDFTKYERYVNEIGELETDNIQSIYQYYMADRSDKKQDFTPSAIGRLVNKFVNFSDNNKCIYDMCSGCGSLAIQQWVADKDISFICKELDETVIPFLLFNLAVRNINAEVYNADVLSGEIFKKYSVRSTYTDNKFFSEVKEEDV